MVSLYVPGTVFANWNLPSVSVLVSLSWPEAAIRTVAPEIGCPDALFKTPDQTMADCCASSETATARRRIRSALDLRTALRRIRFTLQDLWMLFAATLEFTVRTGLLSLPQLKKSIYYDYHDI